MKPKRKLDKMKIAGLAGALVLGQQIAQISGCGGYEQKNIPSIGAVDENGIPYTTPQERERMKREAEEEDYHTKLSKEYTITILPGDTLEGIAKEVYGFRDLWSYVRDTNTASYVADEFPRVFGKTPALKEDFAFKEGFNPNKDLKAGMSIRVYFDNLDGAISYSKKNPERYLR